MSVLAPEGRGCSHCEIGVPMAWFQRAAGGVIRLCIGCLMDWFPGRSADWLEQRLSYFIDHIDFRLAVAQWKETGRQRERPRAQEFVAIVPALKRRS